MAIAIASLLMHAPVHCWFDYNTMDMMAFAQCTKQLSCSVLYHQFCYRYADDII